MNSFFCDPRDQPSYFVVEVADTKLTAKPIKQDGTVLDTLFIDKAMELDRDTPKY